MIIFPKGNIEEHNPNKPRILDHLCKTLIIGSSGSLKSNALLNLMKQQNDDIVLLLISSIYVLTLLCTGFSEIT